MRRWVPVFVLSMIAVACGHGTDVSRESTQTDFGVSMARQNLWREAMFRFQRAVQMNPQDPMAHNNLAVAYEANGDFENARKEYLEALRLDRSNDFIKKNYSRFVEFLSRNKKRSGAHPATVSGAVPTTPQSPGITTTGTGGVVPGQPPDRPVGTDPGMIPRPPQPPVTPPVNPPTTTNPPAGGAA
jgi:hypothetical protein